MGSTTQSAMKLLVLLSLVAGVSALSLKGGASDFPIDMDAALMLNAAVFGFYGLMCQPDLNLPIMNLDMKLHTSRNSAFYNDMEPETVSNTKAYRWIANSFFGIGALSY